MPTHNRPTARRFQFFLLAAISLCLGLAACSSQRSQNETPAQQSAQPAQAEQAKRYDLKGKIVSIDKEKMQLVIDHDAIPGFMGAMTMPYAVKVAGSLENLTPGDQITAQVVVSGNDVWVENIMVVKKAQG